MRRFLVDNLPTIAVVGLLSGLIALALGIALGFPQRLDLVPGVLAGVVATLIAHKRGTLSFKRK